MAGVGMDGRLLLTKGGAQVAHEMTTECLEGGRMRFSSVGIGGGGQRCVESW